MRGVTRTNQIVQKNFPSPKYSQSSALIWYLAALAGLLLFCFSPLSAARTETKDTTAEEYAVSASDSAAPVFLIQGDRGAEVLQLQKQLMSLGYDVDCTGVYGTETASAVRRFQLDCGLVGDGVCSTAVLYAAAYLSNTAAVPSVPEDAVRKALAAAGCLALTQDTQTELSDTECLRNAVILFQRTHGLCGTGEVDYAVLCALGIVSGADLLPAEYDMMNGHASETAVFDLRCRMLCEALSDFVSRYPQAYDLYTLTACAAVLCARTEDVRFPGGFDTVCRMGLLPSEALPPTADGGLSDDLLLLRAAEDALRAFQSGNTVGGTVSGGALYVLPAEAALPQDSVVCFRTQHFVFFR